MKLQVSSPSCFARPLVLTAIAVLPSLSVAGPAHDQALPSLSAAAEPAKPEPAKTDPMIKEGTELVLAGKLQGGMMGIGGETTGWLLKYEKKSGEGSIEVDCSALDKTKIPEGAVRVTGKIIKKDYVERGPTLILKATKIEKQP